MNPFELLKNLNLDEFKKKSQEVLENLKDLTVTGSAGGDFIKVTINGNFNIISIEYEDNQIIKDDIAAFRDLIICAHNDAVDKMKIELQNKFSKSFIPGLF